MHAWLCKSMLAACFCLLCSIWLVVQETKHVAEFASDWLADQLVLPMLCMVCCGNGRCAGTCGENRTRSLGAQAGLHNANSTLEAFVMLHQPLMIRHCPLSPGWNLPVPAPDVCHSCTTIGSTVSQECHMEADCTVAHIAVYMLQVQVTFANGLQDHLHAASGANAAVADSLRESLTMAATVADTLKAEVAEGHRKLLQLMQDQGMLRRTSVPLHSHVCLLLHHQVCAGGQ
jgi:hypothetical protein